jgi:hypothetical protein
MRPRKPHPSGGREARGIAGDTPVGDADRDSVRFDFGIADLMLLGPAHQEVYLVEFRYRCAVVVARGRVIRRTGGFGVVCEHVSADG